MKFLTGLLLIASVIGINSNSLFAQGGWTPEVRIASHNDTYDERIIAKGDSLHVVYWGDDMEIFYVNCSDNGNMWNLPFNLDNPLLSSYNYSPDIISEGDTIVAIWRGIMESNLLGNICFRKSTNNGLTWNNQTTVLPHNLNQFGEAHICNNGSNLFVIANYYDDTLKFTFTKSSNLGRSWSTPLVIEETRETGQFEIANKGDTIHMIWVGRYDFDNRWETYYLKSNDGGDTWTQSINLSTIDGRGSDYPTIAINDNGIIAVCWEDAKYSPNPWNGDIFLRFSYDGGGTWSIEKQITFSHWAIYPRLAWAGDSLHIVWEDDQFGQRDIFYNLSIDAGNNWGAEQRIDSNWYRSSTPDIAISGQYRYLVWGDFRNEPGPGVYFSCWEPGSNINGDLVNLQPEEVYLNAYPNPFNSSTILECKNFKGGKIEIFNPMGQLLKSMTVQKEADKIKWDATDAEGNKVSSGIYFARAKASQYSKSLKLIYIK